MLVFTNRDVGGATDASAFQRSFQPGGTRVGVASVTRGRSAADWKVADSDADVSDAEALNLLIPLFSAERPVCVYLHGNNNPPAACFARCAALEALYGVEVIGFSWAAEGFLADGSELPGVASAPSGDESDLGGISAGNRTSRGSQDLIRCYRQAKTNAQDSVDALSRFLRLLGTARLHVNMRPFTLAAHSLGAHFLQNTLELPGSAESVATAHNVVLLAPCVRAAGHTAWVGNLRPKGGVYITFNQGDSVLFGALIADNGQSKLGTDPGPELAVGTGVRYISFTNSATGLGGHRYFVQDRMPRKAKELFRRVLSSSADLDAGEDPRRVYPLGCEPDGSVCFMAVPGQPQGDT